MNLNLNLKLESETVERILNRWTDIARKVSIKVKINRMIHRFKDDVHPVLHISSAHDKGGPPDINMAQILHLSNFFELKRTFYIHLQV